MLAGVVRKGFPEEVTSELRRRVVAGQMIQAEGLQGQVVQAARWGPHDGCQKSRKAAGKATASPSATAHCHPHPNLQPQTTWPRSVCSTGKKISLCPHPQVVGLYRLCGSAAVKKELRDAFERDSAAVCLSEDLYPDINVITGQQAPSVPCLLPVETSPARESLWSLWDITLSV